MDSILATPVALVYATKNTVRKQQAIFIGVFHHGAGRSCSSIGLEEKANRLLYLLIRVEDYTIPRIVDESDGQPYLKSPRPALFIARPASERGGRATQLRSSYPCDMQHKTQSLHEGRQFVTIRRQVSPQSRRRQC